ncbi:uncharacterized protein with PQ loop repeat [Flavobacterium sp. 28A]|uniref:hypothetical protein n=1 Tax=Flavobacterium sp. 28A TaxID=2735895 RepID=UPI0015706F29|nr:hypothetical protein [Flavobacterium sp. 28A]NRT14100.1 uncharacterized protein with PQ loop repeat [Flavobacterium sp. 28A]
MKVIQYTKQIIKKSIHLIYSTCMNDLIIYSKQASNIELFVLAFFIECNRLFIADSILMNVLQKQVLVKLSNYWNRNSKLANANWIEVKNTTNELLSNNRIFNGLYHKDNIINQ